MALLFGTIGLLAGGIIGGLLGGQENEITNEYNENLKQAVTTTMRATLQADTNATCSNVVNIEGAECCTFNINQECEALASNSVIQSGAFDSTVTQTLVSSLQQIAESRNEGLALNRQRNEANNIVRREVDIGISTEQVFNTFCGKFATGLNQANLVNIYCGKNPDGTCQEKAKPDFVINQLSTVEAIGDCASATVGSSAAMQDVGFMTGQASKVENSGVDMFGLFLAMIGPLMIFIMVPTGYKILTKPNPPQNQYDVTIQNAAKSRWWILVVLGLLLGLWYPGLAAVALGMPPFSRQDLGLVDAKCTADGGLRDNIRVVNDFMWYDQFCLANSRCSTKSDCEPGDECREPYDNAGYKTCAGQCSSNKQVKAYRTCGLFSRQAGCQDPDLDADREAYQEQVANCKEIEVLQALGKKFCDSQSAAEATLLLNSQNSMYPGCRRIDREGDPQDVFGLFVRADPEKLENDPECKGDTADMPLKCFRPATSGILQDRYLAAGIDPVTNKPYVCAAGDTACVSTEADYNSIGGGNECLAEAYQQSKRGYIKLREACTRVEQNTREVGDGPISIERMCEPDPFSYFKCDPATKKCTYTPVGDTESEARSCANDFTGCTDPNFLADLAIDAMNAENCAERKLMQEEYERMRLAIPIVSLIVYLLLIAAAIYMSVQINTNYSNASASFKAVPGDTASRKLSFSEYVLVTIGKSWITFILLELVAIGAIVAGVWLQGWLPGVKAPDYGEGFGIALIAIGAVLLLAFAGVFIYARIEIGRLSS